MLLRMVYYLLLITYYLFPITFNWHHGFDSYFHSTNRYCLGK